MCKHPLDFSSITVSFAHQHVHISFELFIHNYFNACQPVQTSGLFIHKYFIRTSTCAQIFCIVHSYLFHMHINLCKHLYYSSITISFAHQHVHTSLCTLSCAHTYGLFIHVTFFMHTQAVDIHTLSYAIQSLLPFGLFIYDIFNAHSSCAHNLWIVYPCFFTYSAHISGLFILSRYHPHQPLLTCGLYPCHFLDYLSTPIYYAH